MAKELSVLQQQAEAIKNEVNKGANTANRVGSMFSDMLDYNEEQSVTDKANTGISTFPVFSEVTAYTVDQVVNYNDKLYKFTADHPAGAWNSAHVAPTSLKEIQDEKLTELERKNSVLDNNISILRKTLEIEGIEGTGYMSSSNSLALGSFGKHCIYSSIPANIQAKVSTPEGSAGSYYYHLTDVDDNILETFKSGDYIYGYTFKKYDIITKLYASVPSGVKQNIEFGTFYPINALVKEVDCKATFAQNFSDINKVQSIFKTGTKYTGGFETGIYKNDLTYNSAIQFIKTTNILKAESSADYNIIYADFATCTESFYNLVFFDDNDKPILGFNVQGKKCVYIPRGTKYKVSLKNDILYFDCICYGINDVIGKYPYLLGDLYSYIYEEGDGYMSKPNSLEYGSFGKHRIYSNIPANTNISINAYNSIGNSYYYHLTDENDNILETVKSSIGTFYHVFDAYDIATKLYISVQGDISVRYASPQNIYDSLLLLQLNLYEISKNPSDVIKTLNLGVDGDSTTTEGNYNGTGKSWPYFMNEKLHFLSKSNVAMGNAKVCDRTSNTSGTTYYPQWAPDAGEEFVNYWGLSDPNFAGSEGTYQSGTKEFDQATANNCFYSHVGYFISLVNKQTIPVPDIFIFALAGVNDLWNNDLETTKTIIGVFDDVVSEDWEDLTRDTILKSLAWGIQRMRKEYPKCKFYFKTPTQQTKENHKYFYLLYKPLIELMAYLSVTVIDSYAELGIQSDFESKSDPSNNHFTTDGTHPTSSSYNMEGIFVANRIKRDYLVV